MRTTVVSDLHLGSLRDVDVARRESVRERLAGALDGSDRVVVLGDLLELRERPVAELLDLARPVLEVLGEATSGKRLTLLPGNHDHALTEPWLTRLRVEGRELGPEQEWTVGPGDGLAGRLAEWLPDTELTLAYPGVRLRPDVYATHGHYLDGHLTVPRLEALAASAMARVMGHSNSRRTAADHEAALSPLYAFHYALAQGAPPRALRHGAGISRAVWGRAGDSSSGIGAFVLGRITIPGAVALINRTGLGPFRADLTGEELRRGGLAAMAKVVEGLGVEAEHVIFGHTHRPGPLPGDDPAEWTLPGGTRLHNTGSWYLEPVFLGRDPEASPYFPGTFIRVEKDGQPRLDNALRGTELGVGRLPVL
jgi:hypothetical protein